MKKFIKISFWSFIAVGIILVTVNREIWPDFYNPGFMAVAAFVSAFVIIFPNLFFKRDLEKLLTLQFSIALVASINGLGSLGLYKLYLYNFEYDKLAHLLNSLVLTIGVFSLERDWLKRNFKISLTKSALYVFLGGIVWEIGEVLVDSIFETQTLGYYGQYIVRDTMVDILMNTLGIIIALLFIYKKRNSRR